MSKISSILQASYTKLIGQDKELTYQNLRSQRLDICRQCPLFKKAELFGSIVYKCDETSNINGVSGCGCTLDSNGSMFPEKTVLVGNETCPVSKWNEIEESLFYIEEFTKDFLDINKETSFNIQQIAEDIISQGGITMYAKSKDLTLKLKPIVNDSYFNIVELKQSNDEIIYVSYNQLINRK